MPVVDPLVKDVTIASEWFEMISKATLPLAISSTYPAVSALRP